MCLWLSHTLGTLLCFHLQTFTWIKMRRGKKRCSPQTYLRGMGGEGGFRFRLPHKGRKTCGWTFDVSLKECVCTNSSYADCIDVTQLCWVTVSCVTFLVTSNHRQHCWNFKKREGTKSGHDHVFHIHQHYHPEMCLQIIHNTFEVNPRLGLLWTD